MKIWDAATRIFQSTPRAPLGETEMRVFVAVSKLETKATTTAVFDETRKGTTAVSFGSVYAALEKMTWKGYLEGKLGEPGPERGGRARKFYRITRAGEGAFRESTIVIGAKRPLTSHGKRKLQEIQAVINSVHPP